MIAEIKYNALYGQPSTLQKKDRQRSERNFEDLRLQFYELKKFRELFWSKNVNKLNKIDQTEELAVSNIREALEYYDVDSEDEDDLPASLK